MAPRGVGVRSGLAGALVLAAALACVDADPAPRREAPPEPPPPPAVDRIVGADWSSDGERLVAAWDRGEGVRLVGLLAGSPEAPPTPSPGLPLTYGGEARHPTWSPDRLWIAYEAGLPAVPEVHRMRPDGSDPQRLARFAADPAYSPDGRWIAYVSAVPRERRTLHVMDRDGRDGRPVPLEAVGEHADPAWSPDGAWLAVTVEEAEGPWIHVVAPDGNASRRLAAGARPAWAADGTTLFAERGDTVVVALSVQTGEERVVVRDARLPTVDPTGHRLAFVRGNPPLGALYLLDLATGEELRITN